MGRRVTPIQVIALGCAGVGAFFAAAQLPSISAASVPAGSDAPQRAISSAPNPDPGASGASSIAGPLNAAPHPATPASRPATLARVDRSAMIPGNTGEPFATLSWLPPPPPPPPPVAASPPAPPPPPVAPPLPFAFVGMVEQGTPKPEAFLAKGDVLLIVSAGDTLEGGTYHVDSMNATQIVITHLPTNTAQTISVSGGSK